MRTTPFVIAVVIVAVVILGGMLIFQNKNSLFKNQPYESQEPVEFSYDSCTTSADCVLVQDGWCEIVLAVNKIKKAIWQEDNAKQTEIARQGRQTCKPMPEGYFDMNNFRAVCSQLKCIAEFIGNSAQ